MKKNVSRLILEVGQALQPKGRKGIQISCRNAHEYTNKISIDANEYHKPSVTESYINQEMKGYPSQPNAQVEKVGQNIRKKTENFSSIEYMLARLSGANISNILQVQDVVNVIRFTSKKELE